jgi:hypothetical protein
MLINPNQSADMSISKVILTSQSASDVPTPLLRSSTTGKAPQARATAAQRTGGTGAWRAAKALGLVAVTLTIQTAPSHAAWQELSPINTVGWYDGGMGRLNCVAGHPTDSQHLYVGSPSGGLWVTSDGGSTWHPLTDQLPVLGVTSVVVDYANPNNVYLGTGDIDRQDTPSIGVMKSTDGGTNWSLTGLTFALDSGKYMAKLIQHPSQPGYLLAATTDGLYRTENGGVSWERITPGGLTAWWDVAFRPGTPSVIYAVAQQGYFYRSTDTGTNWSPVTAGLPAPSAVDRAKIAVSPANTLGVYVVCDDSTYYDFQGIYQSMDGGSTFTQRSSYNPYFDGFGWYHMAIAASPSNFSEVYVGGQDITKSVDAGASWTDVSDYSVTHVDCHALTYLNGTLYTCTDGGLHKTSNSAASWQDLSSALGIQQVFAMDNAVQKPNFFYIGTRDNGLNWYDSGTWNQGTYGDWESVVLDPTDPQVVYGTFNGTLNKLTTNSFSSLAPTGNANDSIQPLAIDPSNHLTVYAGSVNVWRSLNGGTNWQQYSSFPDNLWLTLQISIAPSNPNYVCALRGGMVWRTTDAGAHWSQQTNGLPLQSYYDYQHGTFVPEGGGVWLAVSSTDPNKLWLAQNDPSTGNKVYASVNGGTNWTAYSGTLPNRQVNCIVYEPGSSDGLYVGFVSGVYSRNAGLSDWQAFNTGLPNASVSQLTIQSTARKLRAATFGRGVWQTDLAGSGPAQFTVTTSSSPVSGGTTSGGGIYTNSQSVTVTATANAGYGFANWTVGGSVFSSAASYNFNVTSNTTLVANFTNLVVNYTVSVSASPSNGGTVAGGGTYTNGQSVTVTGTANAGYGFADWTMGGSVVSSAASYTFNVSSNTTLVANFTNTVINCSITVANSNDNGPGSLRQAIADVCAGGTISFDPSLNGQIIGLTSGELDINNNLTIVGPAANLLAVTGNNHSRIFNVGQGTILNVSGLTLTHGQVSSTTPGAGILNAGTLTLTQCTVSSNQVVYDGVHDANAGGIMNGPSASLTLLNCAVYGNSAFYGAGIYNYGHLTVTQSTICSNVAGVYGAGILCWGDASLTFVTLADNVNVGVQVGGGPVTFQDCVFDSNSGGNFGGGGTITSLGYNLSSDATGNLTAAGDLPNTSAHLGPLADNGGPTLTQALLPGSPAIDAGTNGGIGSLLYDQRGPGYPRLVGGRVDMGAYELQNSSVASTGYSLSFNGVDGYVQVPGTNALNLFPLTITAWLKTTNQAANSELGIVNKYFAASFNGYNLYLVAGHVRAWYMASFASNVFGGGFGLDGGPVADGLWHHVAFAVDATGGKLYVDGSLKQSLPWTGTPGATTSSEPLRIGLYPGVVGSSNYFQGLLDEVQLWNTALSQAEIQAGAYLPLTGTESGLAAYYRFDEVPGTLSTADLAVNLAGVNTGYLSNGVTRVAATGVIHLERPVLGSGEAQLNFHIPFGPPNFFALQATSALPGTWSDVTGAVLTTNIPGASFRFNTATNGGSQSYYRIRAQ